jgi:uncharacterized protein (TIGR04255 family)
VVETLLGVQFKPLTRFRSLHYGIFWRDYLDDLGWESTNVDEPLLERYAESFDNAQLKKNQRLDAEEEVVGVRVRFKNKDGSRSIQFQPDKLYFSWLRTEGEAGQRPHYSELKAEFAKLFRTLTDFANQYELGPIHPDLWEVKYLNQIPSGPLWGEPEEWHRVLPNLFQPAVSPVDGLRFATFQGEWYYEIKPKLGRISVRAAKMLVNQKPPPVLYLRFLARGEIGESGVADWSRGFDIGHGACNQLFNAVTSPEAQKEWDIKNGS